MNRIIFRTGNSTVVSLPREALDFLRLEDGASVSVELDRENHRIVITPVELPMAGVDANFARQVAEFIEEYRPALQALARG
jgi:antitoxin component of MazEF toxin-antitoxin module